jgi:hypothetical protein
MRASTVIAALPRRPRPRSSQRQLLTSCNRARCGHLLALAALFLAAVVSPTVLPVTATASVTNADVIFEDDFEGNWRPEWRENPGWPGSYQSTTEKFEHGSWSVASQTMSSSLNYNFESDPVSNATAEIWFYDWVGIPYYYPNVCVFALKDDGTHTEYHLGVSPLQSDQQYYSYLVGHEGARLGTDYRRTTGWHLVQFSSNDTDTSVHLDYHLIYREDRSHFTCFQIAYLNKPGVSPRKPIYFDNMKMYYGGPSRDFDASDPDGDGIPNFIDNCWLVWNPSQQDSDGDCPPAPHLTDPLCGDACGAQVTIAGQGWHLVGQSRGDIPFSSLLVSDGTQTRSLWDAANVWIQDPFVGYATDGGRYFAAGVLPTDEDSYWRAWQGYWVYSLLPNVRIIFPTPE